MRAQRSGLLPMLRNGYKSWLDTNGITHKEAVSEAQAAVLFAGVLALAILLSLLIGG